MLYKNDTIQRLAQGEEWFLTINNIKFRSTRPNQKNLNQIKRAGQKVREGTYGICDKCGKEIGYALLSACPHAIKCNECS